MRGQFEDLVRLKKRHHTVLTLVFKKLQCLSANSGAALELWERHIRG
jgi:hypothetical protein